MNENISNSSAGSGLQPGSSHLSPAPMGTDVKAKIERGDAYAAPEVFDVEITVLETVRGDDALDLIKEQEVSSDLPAEGFEFLLARIKFGYFRRGKGFGNKPYEFTKGQFSACSSDGRTQFAALSVSKQPLKPLIGESFNPGDVRDGYIVLQVPKGEKRPLLIFNREFVEGVYGIWGYIYFQLY